MLRSTGILIALGTVLSGLFIVAVSAFALTIPQSDGGSPPFLRLAGFSAYGLGLVAISYDITSRLSSARPFSPLPMLLTVLVVLAGAGYFLLFFVFAPWNFVAPVLALPGLASLLWLLSWRRSTAAAV